LTLVLLMNLSRQRKQQRSSVVSFRFLWSAERLPLPITNLVVN
jgi:hypothetical protein